MSLFWTQLILAQLNAAVTVSVTWAGHRSAVAHLASPVTIACSRSHARRTVVDMGDAHKLELAPVRMVGQGTIALLNFTALGLPSSASAMASASQTDTANAFLATLDKHARLGFLSVLRNAMVTAFAAKPRSACVTRASRDRPAARR